MTEPSHAVFLSYASQDAAAAQKICEALRAVGIEVFFDQSELRGGDAWDQKIRKEIHDCALFIPVISAHSDARHEGYFRREWRLAVERAGDMSERVPFLVPVVIDGTSDSRADVPDRFRAVQWTNLPAGETPSTFVDRVQRLLSREAAKTIGVSIASGVASAVGEHAPPRSWSRKRALPVAFTMAILAALAYLTVDKLWTYKHTSASRLVTEKSIAVLPFADLTDTHDQGIFADGLAEEVLDLLSRIPDLKVIARTSSFSFKGKSDDIPTIAEKLGVAHLLEGSVRRSGRHLRVSTHLIRAATGEQIWSETYDRDLTDVFSVQDNIASAVVAALHARLPIQTTQGDSERPKNVEAYTQLLIGRDWLRRGNEEGYRRAAEELRKAIELDPGYAMAYAKLALAEDELSEVDKDASRRAFAAAEKAVALGPDLPDAYMIRGSLLRDRRDWAAATRDLERAVKLDPRANNEYGILLADLGRREEAIRALRRAVEVNPLSSVVWNNLGSRLTDVGRYDEARAALDRAVQLAPEADFVRFNRGYLALRQLNEREARAEFARVRQEPYRQLGEILAEHSFGDRAASKRSLEEYVRRFGVDWAYQIAEAYASLDDADNAFLWLDKAYEQNDVGLSSLKDDEAFAGIRRDPRYIALLHRLNLPE